MTKPLTVQQFFKLFPDDDTCLDHLFRTRFGEQVLCSNCHRISKFYRIQAELAFSCPFCGWHLHPMVGTPFQKTHTSLQRWYYAMYLFSVTRHGVSAKELQRQFGCSYKTAWRMGHEIRKYMNVLDGNGPLGGKGGNVEADETLVGGRDPEGRKGRAKSNKTTVFSMIDRKTGEIISQVVPNSAGATLLPEIEKHVKKGSAIHTDEWGGYNRLSERGYTHHTVNHEAGEWARGITHTNTLEGYFSLFKRSVFSTHIRISRKHMPKYLAEFDYRMNLRKVPHLMFALMLSFRRLSTPRDVLEAPSS